MINALGQLHPALVHFPIAMIMTALVAEVLFIMRKERWFADAARFMLNVGVIAAIPSAIAGFASASGESFAPALQSAFAIHRIAGITTPVLALLALGMLESSRRSGQVWELMLFRLFLILAAASAGLAGYEGGQLVHTN